jgi:hypothetical protein
MFKDIYYSRWGVEELYKVSKEFIIVDDFHGKSERGVKQELFAHFVLITMNRLCSNKAEDQISKMHSLPYTFFNNLKLYKIANGSCPFFTYY